MSWKVKDVYTFNSPINEEGSWGARNLARNTTSVMTLYVDDRGGHELMIEWEIDALDIVEHIGIYTEIDPEREHLGLMVVDYDGVFSLPDQAITLLERNGINCDDVKAIEEVSDEDE